MAEIRQKAYTKRDAAKKRLDDHALVCPACDPGLRMIHRVDRRDGTPERLALLMQTTGDISERGVNRKLDSQRVVRRYIKDEA